jgi:hypothetical protein
MLHNNKVLINLKVVALKIQGKENKKQKILANGSWDTNQGGKKLKSGKF